MSTTLNDGSERKKNLLGFPWSEIVKWTIVLRTQPVDMCACVSLLYFIVQWVYSYDWTVDDPNTKISEMTMSLPKCSIFRCMLLWQVRWIYYILSKRHTLTCKRQAREKHARTWSSLYINVRRWKRSTTRHRYGCTYTEIGDNHDRNEP